MTFLKWVAAALSVVALPMAVAAQSDSGRISGTVIDQTNAFVPGATVTVKNGKTGEVRTTSTNNEGSFLVTPLRPSTYTVTVEKAGFAPIEYPDMPVAVGQELTLDFAFKTATAQEVVTVVGSSPVIDISSAKIGANVSEREVQGLPVNGRQMSQLMLQAPGSQNAGTGTWGDIRFSGRAVEQNVIATTASMPPASSIPPPAWRTAKTRHCSSCRRASKTCRSSASSPAATRPNSAPAPADRSA